MARIPVTPNTLEVYHQRDEHPDVPHHSAAALVHDNLFEGEALDGLYRGTTPQMRILGVTNQRLIMVESTTHDRPGLTSVPLSRVTTVSLLPDVDRPADEATTVAFKVMMVTFELTCRTPEDARAAHDLVVWTMMNG